MQNALLLLFFEDVSARRPTTWPCGERGERAQCFGFVTSGPRHRRLPAQVRVPCTRVRQFDRAPRCNSDRETSSAATCPGLQEAQRSREIASNLHHTPDDGVWPSGPLGQAAESLQLPANALPILGHPDRQPTEPQETLASERAKDGLEPLGPTVETDLMLYRACGSALRGLRSGGGQGAEPSWPGWREDLDPSRRPLPRERGHRGRRNERSCRGVRAAEAENEASRSGGLRQNE